MYIYTKYYPALDVEIGWLSGLRGWFKAPDTLVTWV